MALPLKKAMGLAEDMKKKGLVGSIAMGKPKPSMKKEMLGEDEAMKDDEAMEDDDGSMKDDDLQPVLDDIDALVPGLGDLMMELCDKWMMKDKKQDMEMMDDEDQE